MTHPPTHVSHACKVMFLDIINVQQKIYNTSIQTCVKGTSSSYGALHVQYSTVVLLQCYNSSPYNNVHIQERENE